MSVILYVDFPYTGPWDKEMTIAMQELAQSINNEPGFIWKIWTENTAELCAGGIYLFESQETAGSYLTKHSARLKSFGIPIVNGRIFNINKDLSLLNQVDFIR